MKGFDMKKVISAITAAVCLASPCTAAQVEVNGVLLSDREGWVDNARSYITLQALSREGGYTLIWDGELALLVGEELSLSARPGAKYVEVNGRALYVSEGVKVAEGRSALPLRVLEQALGAEVSWDGERSVAQLDTREARAEQAGYPEEDLYWLSRIISAESRGESLEGQIAVGNVVLNRVDSRRYPDSIKDVVFDRQYGVQFEPVENGTVYNEPTQTSILAAKMALEGAQIVGESLYFYAPALSAGTWIVRNCTYYTTIGCHRFYL